MAGLNAMLTGGYQRPPTLHLYGQRAALERALAKGHFQLLPSGPCLTLAFSSAWDPALFTLLGPADTCLVVHNTEDFGERLHRAVQRALPSWVGIDGAVVYGARGPLGAMFSKPAEDAAEREWLFAWRPMQANLAVKPVVVELGSIEGYAELRGKDTLLS